ncbi:hypothetical protein BDN71DRAFT_1506993 [Pleurotus eryngii]|uniref:tripeptidyl-peptidase II n=1 Tax=Pleurotus eryngii TaxID=5323 RepID=A0A9P5ZWN0_PLEER|nr:hypothetical protein BDN71DRAFT_1506993 [Pleurotus eryngii]
MKLPLLASLFLAAQAAIITHPHATVLHEKRDLLPSGWAHARRHDPSAIIPLKFALTQSNMHRLEEFLNEVSHPKSPQYGNHWTAGKIADTFAPSEETISTVHNWLVGSGIPAERIKISPTKGWINVDASVAEANDLLRTEYNVYVHESGKSHVGCNEYHLPAHVAQHVELVLPSVHFDARVEKRGPSTTPVTISNLGQPGFGITPKTTGKVPTEVLKFHNAKQDAAAAADYCWLILTPDCLRTLYGLNYTTQAADKNSFGVVEYTPQAYLQSDIDMFHFNYSREIMGKTPNIISIDGGESTLITHRSVLQTQVQNFAYNGESDLDLEYAMNLVGVQQNITLYQVGDLVQGASFNNFLDAIDGSYCTFDGGDDIYQDPHYPNTQTGGWKGAAECGTVKPTNVISTSYGYNEADLNPTYTARQCAEYAKLGLMGITMLFSSGDSGVGGNNGVCMSEFGFPDAYGPVFNPGFPASCPFVTVVGATQINKNAPVTAPEAAINQVIFSGGGFSNHFAMPDYQKDHVNNYLENFPPSHPDDIWNSTGVARAFPDIAANGANFVAAVNGQFILVYGTSASTPVIGALITLINDARLAAGKKTVGFINPTVSPHFHRTFYDSVVRMRAFARASMWDTGPNEPEESEIYSPDFSDAFNDIVAGNNSGCGSSGFNATSGWDPVTGLGTPRFEKLLEKWLSLP